MLSGVAHITWNSSHATSIAQASARRSEQTGASAEQTHHEASLLWQRVECVLTDAQELRVAYLLFQCGLTPYEIVQCCTDEFADVQEVLSLRCTIMKKLVRIV